MLVSVMLLSASGCSESPAGDGSGTEEEGFGENFNADDVNNSGTARHIGNWNGSLQGSPYGNSTDVSLMNGDTYAVINVRDFGEMKIALFPSIAPVTVNSFVELAQSGFYEGRIFHRIIDDFMIQGGSLNGDGMGDPNFDTFDTEPSEIATHIYGAISTANSGHGTNGQQFFIVNTDETPHLNGAHTVFGQMVDGFDVLDAISEAETEPGDRPVTPVVIDYIIINTYESEEERVMPRGNLSGEVTLQEGDTYAVLSIENFGDITMVLFPEIAPMAVENFINLSETGAYEGRIFHRIIRDFMIQGGSPNGDGMGDPDFPTFDTEPSPYALHLYGALSTANAGPGTNGEQFFIVNTTATPWLNGNHTVFGHVVDGFDVLEAVSAVETEEGDRPVDDIVIAGVTIHTYGEVVNEGSNDEGNGDNGTDTSNGTNGE